VAGWFILVLIGRQRREDVCVCGGGLFSRGFLEEPGGRGGGVGGGGGGATVTLERCKWPACKPPTLRHSFIHFTYIYCTSVLLTYVTMDLYNYMSQKMIILIQSLRLLTPWP